MPAINESHGASQPSGAQFTLWKSDTRVKQSRFTGITDIWRFRQLIIITGSGYEENGVVYANIRS